MKKRWKKGELSRTIVRLCIGTMIAVLVWAVAITSIAAFLDKQIDISSVLTFAGSFFGGELVLLAFKRIFAKDRGEVDEVDEETHI